jgi:transposase
MLIIDEIHAKAHQGGERCRAEYGYEHPLWTCQRIRQVISAELNLVVSVPTLWRELKKLKLSCQKPERHAL